MIKEFVLATLNKHNYKHNLFIELLVEIHLAIVHKDWSANVDIVIKTRWQQGAKYQVNSILTLSFYFPEDNKRCDTPVSETFQRFNLKTRLGISCT